MSKKTFHLVQAFLGFAADHDLKSFYLPIRIRGIKVAGFMSAGCFRATLEAVENAVLREWQQAKFRLELPRCATRPTRCGSRRRGSANLSKRSRSKYVLWGQIVSPAAARICS